MGQGREGVKNLLKDNPELAEEIAAKIVNAMNGTPEAEEIIEEGMQ